MLVDGPPLQNSGRRSHAVYLITASSHKGFGSMSIKEGEPILRAGPVEVRPAELTALARGRALHLSVQEFRLLTVLVGRKDRVVSREDLYHAGWEAELRDGDRSVDVYVSKLRTKLARALPEFVCIHTHIGFGYRFSPERSPVFHTMATSR